MLWVIEVWRGLAALLVVWAHWGPPLGWPTGWMAFAFTGVDLFFVLSGFVFAPSLLQRPPPDLGAFALRRLARIYPAYLAALAVYVLLAWMAGLPLLYLPEHVLMAHLQSREMAFYYNPAFWSLPAELGFYALVPLLAWRMAGSTGPGIGSALRWGLLLGGALLLRLILLHAADGAAQNLAYVLLNHVPGLLVEFLLGTWAWRRWQAGVSPRAALALGLGGLLGWCLLASLFVHLQAAASSPSWLAMQWGLGAAVCFATLVLASLRLPAPAAPWLRRAGDWCGRLSYATYLLHMAWLAPATAWAQRWGGSAVATALALVALLLSCLLLHLMVEEPARRWGRAWAARLEARHGTGAVCG